MTKDIDSGETGLTPDGETDTYINTLDNAGTYDNAGTVNLAVGTVYAGDAKIASSGWSISITHPNSGRVIRPDAINPDQVQYIPGPNTRPRVRMPVRRGPDWLDEGFDNNPEMTVHLDGEQRPIDELVDVEQQEGQTILIGEGASELRTTVQPEYEAKQRPAAATELVSNNTSYAVVDNTAAGSADTSTVQDPSGESELGNFITPGTDPPLQFTGGGLKPRQTAWTVEAEDYDSGNAGKFTSAEYSGDSPTDGEGYAAEFGSDGDYAEWTFTTGYDISDGDFSIYVRENDTFDLGDTQADVELFFDGNSLGTFNRAVGLGWTDLVDSTSDPGAVSAGSHTIRLECVTSGSGSSWFADVIAPLDNRFSYTFDNTVTTYGSGNALDGPEHYPDAADAVFDAHSSAFSIVGGEVTVDITDTSGAQALALSNDFGSSYDITGSNTASLDGSFPDTGAAINLKATLSRYEPSGAQNATPRLGYDAQRLDGYTLKADIEAESLLIDESYDNSLSSVLNQILGSEYGWTVSIENGTTTFTVDEPGSTVADSDPEISEATVEKQVQTYKTVRIKGSNLPVSGETFTASASFVNLNEDSIVTGSEAVYDSSGTQFTRGVDYAMDYQGGQIKALSGGSLSTGTDYNIDYRHQIAASHTVPTATGDTLTRTIPGVVSDRQAEQIAYVLAEVYPGVATPRYEGRIVVPRLDVTFDPLEGLELADFDLPDVATPLSIRGEPEVTPLGLTLNLGSAPRLEESLSNIREQVSAVSDRV